MFSRQSVDKAKCFWWWILCDSKILWRLLIDGRGHIMIHACASLAKVYIKNMFITQRFTEWTLITSVCGRFRNDFSLFMQMWTGTCFHFTAAQMWRNETERMDESRGEEKKRGEKQQRNALSCMFHHFRKSAGEKCRCLSKSSSSSFWCFIVNISQVNLTNACCHAAEYLTSLCSHHLAPSPNSCL